MNNEQTPNHFPIVLDMKIYITDGENHGIVTFRCPCFKTVSNDYILDAVVKTSKEIPDGYRLMTHQEVHIFLLTDERAIEGLVIPNPKEGEIWFSQRSFDEGKARQ